MSDATDQTDQTDRAYWDAEAATFDDEPDHGLLDPATREAWRQLLAAHPSEDVGLAQVGLRELRHHPQRLVAGAVPVPDENNHEIFSPPYLFKGVRPTITSAPTSVGYQQTFTIATPNAAQVTTVRWTHIGSVTHAFDFGQRANTLTFTRTATGVSVTAPSDPKLAPRGHYILFILNRNGVPSTGQIIKLQ